MDMATDNNELTIAGCNASSHESQLVAARNDPRRLHGTLRPVPTSPAAESNEPGPAPRSTNASQPSPRPAPEKRDSGSPFRSEKKEPEDIEHVEQGAERKTNKDGPKSKRAKGEDIFSTSLTSDVPALASLSIGAEHTRHSTGNSRPATGYVQRSDPIPQSNLERALHAARALHTKTMANKDANPAVQHRPAPVGNQSTTHFPGYPLARLTPAVVDTFTRIRNWQAFIPDHENPESNPLQPGDSRNYRTTTAAMAGLTPHTTAAGPAIGCSFDGPSGQNASAVPCPGVHPTQNTPLSGPITRGRDHRRNPLHSRTPSRPAPAHRRPAPWPPQPPRMPLVFPSTHYLPERNSPPAEPYSPSTTVTDSFTREMRALGYDRKPNDGSSADGGSSSGPGDEALSPPS
ncbi:MAG: hypothetical protein Q9164_005650 [Protoblastenia rupestris]